MFLFKFLIIQIFHVRKLLKLMHLKQVQARHTYLTRLVLVKLWILEQEHLVKLIQIQLLHKSQFRLQLLLFKSQSRLHLLLPKIQTRLHAQQHKNQSKLHVQLKIHLRPLLQLQSRHKPKFQLNKSKQQPPLNRLQPLLLSRKIH